MADLERLHEVLPAMSSDLDASRRHYEASWAASTLRAYRADWRCWVSYCADRRAEPLRGEPFTVAAYLSALADGTWGRARAVSTIERRRAAISHVHIQSGHADPTDDPRVARVLAGIRRSKTVRKARKDALRTDDIIRMVDGLGGDPRGLRDCTTG